MMPDDTDIPHLAVIVVCYHSGAVIQSCIDALDDAVSVVQLGSRTQVELVLIANSPEDRVAEVTSRECRVTPIYADGNVGFSPAVNLGLAVVPHAEFVLLLNPDARLSKDCLAAMLSAARSDGAAIVGPILCDSSGQPHGASERPFHSVRREFATQLLGAGRRRPAYGKHAYETGDARCLTGACLLVEGSFFRIAGGLDTEVRMYLEDVVLCWQAHEHGRPVLLVPNALCYHALGESAEGANFVSSLGLHLTLLGARVAFVRRKSGHLHALMLRMLIGIGAVLRAASATGPARKMQLAVLRWAIASGDPPPWQDGPIVAAR
jgi:N-acetylglucosaminyl-diphospho-decaprenol L-rhamnosyltransferase